MTAFGNEKDEKTCLTAKSEQICADKEYSDKYDLPDYLPDINRLLRTTVRHAGVAYTVNGNSMDYAGTFYYRILYADIQGEIKSASFESPFFGSVSVQDYEDGRDPVFSLEIESVVCRLQGPRKLTFKTKVKLCTAVFYSVCTSPVIGGNPNAEERNAVQYHRAFVPTQTVEHVKSTGNAVSEDLEIPSSYPPIGEILSLETHACLCDLRPSENGISYKGDVITSVFYTARQKSAEEMERDGEDPMDIPYCFFMRKVPIYGTITTDSAKESAICSGFAHVTQTEYRVSAGALGENRLVELDFEYDVSVACYTDTQSDIVDDAYCLTCENGNEYKTLSVQNAVRAQNFHFSLNESVPNADADFTKIIYANARADVESVTKEGNKLVMEGKAEVSLIAAGEEGGFVGKVYTVPMRAVTEAGNTTEPFSWEADACVLALSCRADKEFVYVDAEISVDYTVFKNQSVTMLSQSVLYRDKPIAASPAALTVYYPTENESLWDIAKRYHTTETALREANTLSGDTALGKQILILHSKKRTALK